MGEINKAIKAFKFLVHVGTPELTSFQEYFKSIATYETLSSGKRKRKRKRTSSSHILGEWGKKSKWEGDAETQSCHKPHP